MAPPTHIAVVNHSTRSDRDIAFEVEAVALQLREHVAPLWDEAPPGLTFYGTAEHVPADQAAVLGYVNDDGNADSAGYHADAAGLVYGLVDVGQSPESSITLSHEGAEMYGNQHLDRKVVGKDGRAYYVELSDPVQAATYEIEVELFGERRRVKVSDFVLPAWFGLPNKPAGGMRTTYLGQPLKPFQVDEGGYQIIEDVGGGIVFVTAGGAPRLRRSKHSRTSRIVERMVLAQARPRVTHELAPPAAPTVPAPKLPPPGPRRGPPRGRR